MHILTLAAAVALTGAWSCTHRKPEPNAEPAVVVGSSRPPGPAPRGRGRPQEHPAPAPAPATTAVDREWTAGIVQFERSQPVQTQASIRVGKHAGYERIVFEFDHYVPGYHIEYIDKPVRDCGAGDVRPIAGEAWLEVRLSPARAHDDDGRPTVAEREFTPQLDLALELELTCDFEAVLTWVVGLRSPNRYRVFELSNPPRLVVDIRTE